MTRAAPTRNGIEARATPNPRARLATATATMANQMSSTKTGPNGDASRLIIQR